jgi:hydroxymethylbilane synthase
MPMSAALRLGTRRSPLAKAQSTLVAEALRRASRRDVMLVEITTHGDVDRGPLATIGGTGVFVSALRDAMLAGTVDIAVHSLKDLPTAPADGLVTAAVPGRADPRDALVGAALADLPAGSRVGTGSPRRAAALRALDRGLRPVAVRGNVDTRLAMVADGSLDAVVLAMAGLVRLNRLAVVAHPVDPALMLPAPGQGALAVEARDDVAEAFAGPMAEIDDPASHAAVRAERAALARLEAGCSAPVGALAAVHGDELTLNVRVWAPDGSHRLDARGTGLVSSPDDLGHALADDLLARGAGDLMHDRSPDLSPDRAPQLKETAP